MTFNFFSSFLVVLLAATLVLLVITRLAAGRLIRTHHAQKADFFRRWPVQHGDIVMLGDSITEGARWHEIFPGLPIKNRGINADTTTGVLSRLSEILAGQPAAIFILIGTNDLPWYMFRRDERIVANYQRILDRIAFESPETRVFVQSILPRHPRYSNRIQQLNTRIKEMVDGCNCTYIDLFAHFAGQNGGLRPELTNDRLHLLAEGYTIWSRLLAPYLEGLNPRPQPFTQVPEPTESQTL